MKIICPCCNKERYKETEGEYDIPDESGAKKLSPKTGYCESCGFYYSEHINYSLEQQVKRFKQTCNCNDDCNTDIRTLFVCKCPCHYR